MFCMWLFSRPSISRCEDSFSLWMVMASLSKIIWLYVCGFSAFVHLTGISNGTSGKESASQCRKPRRWKFYPGLGRSSGVGNGNPFQYSCMGNFMEREAWQGQGATKSWTWLNTHSHSHSLSLSLSGLWKISFSLSIELYLCSSLSFILSWLPSLKCCYFNRINLSVMRMDCTSSYLDIV